VAREHGLRFGVSNHSSHAWHWFQVAYGHDVEGPLAGVPYDAAQLTEADGKGKWWDGLDPKDLYCGLRIPMPDNLKTAKEAEDWHWKHDGFWFERIPPYDNGYAEKWFLRTQDLIDKYHPDLLYFDDTELPLERFGLSIAAHLYNSNEALHGGRLEAVINAKNMRPDHAPGVVSDIERGVAEGIRSEPWQTDTCIGDWHYNRHVFLEHRYKTVGEVVRMLTDIVSKNGNLLLSIPIPGDGAIDSDEVKFLHGMAAWMTVNSEAIFDTRPWSIYGEGPSTVEKAEAGRYGGARDVQKKPYTSEDIRFTTKGDVLYAIMMAWPEQHRVVIQSLAKGSSAFSGRKIDGVTLLGHPGKIEWNQDEAGLHVQLPAMPPCKHAFVVKIQTSAGI
jgi:alpha-L-fucosidase